MMNRKVFGRKRSWPILKVISRNSEGGAEKTTKNLRIAGCLVRYLNARPVLELNKEYSKIRKVCNTNAAQSILKLYKEHFYTCHYSTRHGMRCFKATEKFNTSSLRVVCCIASFLCYAMALLCCEF
jgi:hypothetical protein